MEVVVNRYSLLFGLRSFDGPSFSCTPQFLLALLLLELAQANAKLFGLNAKLGPVGWSFFGLFGCVVCHRNPTYTSRTTINFLDLGF